MVRKNEDCFDARRKEEIQKLEKKKALINQEIKQYNIKYSGLLSITPKAKELKKKIATHKEEYERLKKEL